MAEVVSISQAAAESTRAANEEAVTLAQQEYGQVLCACWSRYLRCANLTSDHVAVLLGDGV